MMESSDSSRWSELWFWFGCVLFLVIAFASLPGVMQRAETQRLEKQSDAMNTEGEYRRQQFWREKTTGQPHREYAGPTAKPYGD